MKVLTYGGFRDIHYIKKGNRMWPCTPQTAASKFFFGSIDISRTFDHDEQNINSRITYYESPELYWQTRISKPHIDDYKESENPQNEYQIDLEKYIQDLQTFKENNKGWYENKRNMIKDMGTFVSKLRHDRAGIYPENGYECYSDLKNDEIYEMNEIFN